MVPTPRRCIAVTGGGTAGHILPGLDFLEAYRRETGAEGFFIGCADGMEGRLVPAHGVRLELIPGKPWARQGWSGRVAALANLVPGILAARRILQREKVDLVIGTGGYAALGTCIAARMLGVPVAIHEPNVETGLANRLIAKFADVIAVGFEETRRALGPRSVVTGVPTRPVLRQLPAIPNFIVLGGSEGSPLLNTEAPRLFSEMRRRGVPFTVRHLTGFGGTAAVEAAYAEAGVPACVEGFVIDMRPVYASGTFALAAAGACTLAELSACGIPCLAVPTPGTARGHQLVNARYYAERNGALLAPEGRWDVEALASRIEAVLKNAGQTPDVRQVTPEQGSTASVAMVRECEALLERLRPAAVTVPGTL